MSYDIVKETVPRFVRRVGDQVIEGSNNTIIILGTDRAAPGQADLGSGLGSVKSLGGGVGTGTAHIIVGRQHEDPDFIADRSFMYLSMKTEVDKNLQLTNVQGDSGKVSAAVFKADSIRLVFRKDLKISLAGGKGYIWIKENEIIVDGSNIKLGDGATERLVLGDKFMQQWANVHTHQSPAGPTSPPLKPMTPDMLSQRKVTVK